ncbi:MAG: hypothetical protein ACQEVA_10535 [Myxococcota bacterium]
MSKTKQSPFRKRFTAWPMLVALAVALSFGSMMTGCKDKGEMPDSAEARVEQMGNRLPADTELATVVGDLAKMRESITTAKDKLGDTVPMTDLFEEQAKDELGVDMTDPESWKKAGIAPNGGLTLAVVNDRPVFMTYVKDKKKFEKHFADQIKKSYNIEGMPKTEGGDTKVKVMGKADGDQIAWTYFGELAIVSFPPADNFEGEPGPIVDTVETVATTKEENALAQTQGYKDFTKALAKDNALAVYINTGKFLDEDRMKEIESNTDELGIASAKWIQENVDGAGLGMNVDGNKATVRAWFGFDDETNKTLEAVNKPTSAAPFKNLATQNTLAGLRMSVNWDEFWTLYMDAMPEDERKQFEKQIAQAGQMAGEELDVQKDVIDQLSGNIGVFFYGANIGEILNARGRGMAGTIPHLGLIATVEFKSAEALDKVAKGIIAGSKGAVERRPLQLDDGESADKIEVLAVKNIKESPGQLYIQGTKLAFATSALSEQSMFEYLTGERDEGNLADADNLDLGENFAGEEKYNGLYVNVVRAKNHLMGQKDKNPMIAQMVNPAETFLNTVEEMSLTSEITDMGGFMTLTVDMVPGAAEKSGDSKESDKE